jgi:hypothetical protein
VEKEPGRGCYRRRRERRPMVGVLVHLDASTHQWIAGSPDRDLIVALDDADGVSFTPSSLPRRARFQPSRRCAPYWGTMGGFASCTPSAAPTSDAPPKPVKRRPRSRTARWPKPCARWASGTSRPAPHRRGDAASAPLKRSRAACHKNCACPALPTMRKPTATLRGLRGRL